jgi:hypothetical protein
MTITIIIPLLVCLAGILIYALPTNATLKEIARAMMWTGMLASLLLIGQHVVKF